jgi:hypothetical protein
MSEEISFQEIEALLDSVISNKRLIKLEHPDGVDFILFSFPTTQELMISRYIREKALVTAKEEGLISLEDAKGLIDKVTSQEEKDKIKKLEEQIEGQKLVLNITAIEARREAVKENIERLEAELTGLQAKSHNFLYLSQERKADEESFLYMVWLSSYEITGNKFWETFDGFEEDPRHGLRNKLIEEFAKFNVGLPSKTIRLLARHSLWRIRYVAAVKTGQKLFANGLSDLTPDQLSLLYWSNYYQSIYEMMPDDQPSQEIIDDDDKLDEYMNEYFKNKEEERVEGRAEKRSGSSKKLNAWDRGEELIITPSHPDYINLAYSKERVKAAEGVSDIEVIAPGSRRARNRRSRAKSKTAMRGGKR